MLQPVDYWQGKGQSSSLECGDTHKLFNFHPQRSVVRKYWAGQRWRKHEIKRQAGKSAAYFTLGFVFGPLLFFWVIIQSRRVWFFFFFVSSVVKGINFNARFNVLTWNTFLSIKKEWNYIVTKYLPLHYENSVSVLTVDLRSQTAANINVKCVLCVKTKPSFLKTFMASSLTIRKPWHRRLLPKMLNNQLLRKPLI